MKWSVLILAFFIGCASQEDRSEPIPSGEKLLETFALDESEKNKFVFEEIKPAPVADIPEDRPQLKPMPSKAVVERPAVLATPKAMPKRVWPEGYPEEFKELEARAKKTWEQFRPLIRVGETLRFQVSYLGITAGTITFKVLEDGKRGEDLVHHFKATLSSAKYYSYIYRLDDYVESFVLADTFMPLKYTLIQRESGQSVDDLQLFDHEKFQSKQWLKKIKDGKTRQDDKVAFIPPVFLDPLSLLSFFRGLPLEVGDDYFIPLVIRSKLWIIEAKVVATENVHVADKDYLARRLEVRAIPSEEGKKEAKLNLWYAATPSRELLRFDADLKFGTVLGELLP